MCTLCDTFVEHGKCYTYTYAKGTLKKFICLECNESAVVLSTIQTTSSNNNNNNNKYVTKITPNSINGYLKPIDNTNYVSPSFNSNSFVQEQRRQYQDLLKRQKIETAQLHQKQSHWMSQNRQSQYLTCPSGRTYRYSTRVNGL